MGEADLRKRRRILDDLAVELRSPPKEKTRKTMKKPEALLFGAGDVLAFRIDDRGSCNNPYQTNPRYAHFEPAGWDGCVILRSGLALDYLARYQVGTARAPWMERPTLEQVMTRIMRASVGTISKSHAARMGLEGLGTAVPPKSEPPLKKILVWTTAQGICASNHLSRHVEPEGVKFA